MKCEKHGTETRVVGGLLLALLFAAPAFAQAPPDVPAPVSAPGPRVTILAGGLASLGGDTGSAVTPLARVAVELPLAQAALSPRLHVTADLSALPGETVTLEDPATFRAIEFSLAVSQRLHRKVNFGLYAEAGFASRLPADPAPRVRAARWLCGGLRFGAFGRGWLEVGLGVDQRHTAGEYQPAVVVAGAVTLYEREGGFLAGAAMQLIGSAVLGADFVGWPGYSSGRGDVVRVGIGVGTP